MNLEKLRDLSIYPRSEVEVGGTTYMLVRGPAGKRLAVVGDTAGLEGTWYGDLFLCPLAPGNAAAMRDRLPWLRPRPLGPSLPSNRCARTPAPVVRHSR
jgi:hypothetical protein